MTHATDTWSVSAAKNHLGEVIDRAVAEGPQVITRNGRKAAVIVSAEEWARKVERKGSLADFFAASPLCGAELDVESVKDQPQPSG